MINKTNNNKLIAPKPKKLNPFLKKNSTRSSFENNLFYRNSDKIKNDKNYFPNNINFNIEDLKELERDFDEIEARSEIFSILQSDNSCSTTFFHRNSDISNFSFDFNEKRSYIPLSTSTINSNNINS